MDDFKTYDVVWNLTDVKATSKEDAARQALQTILDKECTLFEVREIYPCISEFDCVDPLVDGVENE